MTDWIEWSGGECPVKPGVRVEIRFRNGPTHFPYSALNLRWAHTGEGGDIIAYRVVSA